MPDTPDDNQTDDQESTDQLSEYFAETAELQGRLNAQLVVLLVHNGARGSGACHVQQPRGVSGVRQLALDAMALRDAAMTLNQMAFHMMAEAGEMFDEAQRQARAKENAS